ncbi:hypothetical protein [Actinokineospora iranica]|uniref:hypothetical protein n=1 Tax=Actinokineospora iranica TaxID=1271860 RepID=UPI0011143BA7|nr:hypothetical protein [Actinokineospora iranica]
MRPPSSVYGYVWSAHDRRGYSENGSLNSAGEYKRGRSGGWPTAAVPSSMVSFSGLGAGATTGRHDRPAHAAESGGSVTVAELVAQALRDGRPIRLARPAGDQEARHDEEWPTDVLPRVDAT